MSFQITIKEFNMIYSKIKQAQKEARINLKNILEKGSIEALHLKIEGQSLTTLMGELENKATATGNKEVADELVVSTLKKFIKDLKFTIEKNEIQDVEDVESILTLIKNSTDPLEVEGYQKKLAELIRTETDPLKIELNVLNEILLENGPKQLNEDELTSLIKSIVANGATNMGVVMGELKKNHAGYYDGKSAAMIAKNIF